jgi:hypothetical protein
MLQMWVDYGDFEQRKLPGSPIDKRKEQQGMAKIGASSTTRIPGIS